MRVGSEDLALTAEKDETPQCIEIKFVDEKHMLRYTKRLKMRCREESL